ncbi:SsgA family sporulation/cell division regulator [Kitasatospora sp. NPDC002040]|uniref:SsgA family sporulation/cell division regulator n=1 Tax=Kitasatospora sp. NPDC002040 TaxID=3154661 RepID=UPI0033224FA2
MNHWQPLDAPAKQYPAARCAVPLELKVVTCTGRSISIAACLKYSASDPYAVRLDIYAGYGTSTAWVFARDLLTVGVSRAVGADDVSVHPLPQGGRPTVVITLRGQEDTGVLHAQTSRVRRFLALTERIVATGQESGRLDIDMLLRRLLDEGPAGSAR